MVNDIIIRVVSATLCFYGGADLKILLTTLNSKFIHSNLAIRYLRSFCNETFDVQIKEYTINDNINSTINDIFLEHADIVAFSCYIWNIEQTLKVVSTLRSADKDIKIILGGPEVSYNPEEFLIKNPEADYIIFGEGELTLKQLLNHLHDNNGSLKDIYGLAFRNDKGIEVNEARELIKDLNIIYFPYQDELDKINGKMVYYETSRGCPYNCQYCLSSTISGVRYFSINRVKKDLSSLINAGVSQIKFVDRTFNCHKERTKEIFEYLIKLNPSVNFHFEISAELLDDEILTILREAPEGLFQFEIGVQSTNEETLGIIFRKSNFETIRKNVSALSSFKNIHLHLDLIAGLPKEDYKSFKNSFNDVYGLKPQMLQLGFLKLLRGSGLRMRSDELGIKYNNYTPYEVISTNELSYSDIIKLKDIEDCLEKYYNSNRFSKTMEYITNNLYSNPFDFFEEFSGYWRNNSLFDNPHSTKRLYTILLEFAKQNFNKHIAVINELLKFDFLSNEHSYVLPEGIERKESDSIRRQLFIFFNDKGFLGKYLPQYINLSAKQIIKKVNIEAFKVDVLAKNKDIYINDKSTVILFDYDVENKIFRRSRIYNISEYFTV